MRGEQKKKKNPRNKIWKLKTLQIWTPLPIGATGIVASIYWRSVGIPILNSSAEFLNPLCRVLPIRQALPIDFALLGRKRKYIKSKTTAELIEKRTSIAAVQDKLGLFDTFPTPLLSRCRLPLRRKSKRTDEMKKSTFLDLNAFFMFRPTRKAQFPESLQLF
jgi:hypothetical protein